MEQKRFYISHQNTHIPAILWGAPSKKMAIAVHGNLSNKEDTVIDLFAQAACAKGYRVLSFDLPQHGERVGQEDPLLPQICVRDLTTVYEYARMLSTQISLFACSMGAYFSLLAYHKAMVEQSLFLSPVVDMEALIQSMMREYQVPEHWLQKEKTIRLPNGQTLDWDYYHYVKSHPVHFRWKSPTAILYGEHDELTAWERIQSFSARYNAVITVEENAAHFFHTPHELQVFREWVEQALF